MREGKRVGNKTFYELSPVQMIAALEDKVGRDQAHRALETCARMFRVAGAQDVRLVPGLEVAARLAELYMGHLDPSGRCMTVAVEKLVRTIKSVDLDETKAVDVVIAPQEKLHRVVARVKRLPGGGKVARISQAILKLRDEDGALTFTRSMVEVQEGESYEDINNAIQALRRKRIIFTVSGASGLYEFTKEIV